MKPIKFLLNSDSAGGGEENAEWKDYRVKQYPRLPPGVHLAGFVFLGAGFGAGSLTGHPMLGFLGGLVACVVLIYNVHPIQCPECKGRVHVRLMEYDDEQQQYFYDCPVCRISWENRKFRKSD